MKAKRNNGSQKAVSSQPDLSESLEKNYDDQDRKDFSEFNSDNYKVVDDPTDKIYNFGQNLRFFELIQVGGPNCIQEIEKILENDPKRNFYPKGHASCLVNQRNRKNQTPVYIAVENNNLEIVKLLVNHGADVKQKSKIDCKSGENFEETTIEVAARWGFTPIMSFLLQVACWTPDELRCACRAATSDSCRKEIKKLYQKSSCCVVKLLSCTIF